MGSGMGHVTGARRRVAFGRRMRTFAALLALAVAALAGGFAVAPRAASAQGYEWRELFDRGLGQLRANRYDDSIATFRRVIDVWPEPAEPYYNIACAYALKGDGREAVAWLGRAIDHGFRDVPHILEDADLDPLRLYPPFHTLLEERFGHRSPALPLTTFGGQAASLEPLRGQVVLLLLWRSWSEPSARAAALLDVLQDKNRERGLFAIGVSTEEVEAQESFADEHKLAFTLLRQTADMPRPVNDLNAFPTLLVIDREGIIRHRLTGTPDEADLSRLLEPLLNPGSEAPPPPSAPGKPAQERGVF